MIAALCFLVAVLTIAYLEAGTDAGRIAEHKPIDHGKELKERIIAVLVCGALICLSFGAWEWRTLYWLPMAWGLFTFGFRWWLNRKRGKDMWYIAPWSNNYDRLWYAVACWTWWTDAELRSHAIWLRDYEKSTIVEVKDIRLAGRLAYITEALVFAASFTAYTLTNT